MRAKYKFIENIKSEELNEGDLFFKRDPRYFLLVFLIVKLPGPFRKTSLA
jgi:hypothetical protein